MPSLWYLGGQTIVKAGWASARAVAIEFVSQYTSGWQWQLYAGRQRIGVTDAATDRRIVGQLIVDDVPAPLTLIRVRDDQRLTDFGPQLPSVPWHRFELLWSATSFPADTARFVLTASTAPGEPPDADNILAEPPFAGDGAYGYRLPPLPRSGAWTYRVTPYDDARPLGNPGTPAEVTVQAAVPPPDVTMFDDGRRFSVNVDEGELMVSFTYGAAA